MITHTHSDHISGLHELRPFFFGNRKIIPIYDKKFQLLFKQFDFLFDKKPTSPSYFIPPMSLNEIKEGNIKFLVLI